jgi:mono/diheme cytochrome c family protein
MRIWRLGISMVAALALEACASEKCLDTSGAYTGAQLFRASCSGCHGVDARGNGPVAEFINVRVPDLTKINATHGGEFPAAQIYRIIDGQSDMPAHGTRHMPVWGYEFFGAEGNDQSAHGEASDKVDSLVKYLRTLQQPQ